MATGYVRGNESPEIEKLKEQAWALYNKTKNWSDPAILALHEKAEQLRALQGYSGGQDGSKKYLQVHITHQQTHLMVVYHKVKLANYKKQVC